MLTTNYRLLSVAPSLALLVASFLPNKKMLHIFKCSKKAVDRQKIPEPVIVCLQTLSVKECFTLHTAAPPVPSGFVRTT